MQRQPITITFNPDSMSVGDLKLCSGALASILRDFDRILMQDEEWTPEQTNEFALRVLQIADKYQPWDTERD